LLSALLVAVALTAGFLWPAHLHRYRRYALQGMLGWLAMIPSLPFYLAQRRLGGEFNWIPKPGLTQLYAEMASGIGAFSVFVMALLVLALLAEGRRGALDTGGQRTPARMRVIALLAGASQIFYVAAWIESRVASNIFLDRYLFPLSLAWMLAIAFVAQQTNLDGAYESPFVAIVEPILGSWVSAAVSATAVLLVFANLAGAIWGVSRLVFSLAGSAVLTHVTNSFASKHLPGLDQVLKQNPSLMKELGGAVMGAMASNAAEAEHAGAKEGGGGGMGNLMSGLMGFMSNVATQQPGPAPKPTGTMKGPRNFDAMMRELNGAGNSGSRLETFSNASETDISELREETGSVSGYSLSSTGRRKVLHL
jgi:amino acid transporter